MSFFRGFHFSDFGVVQPELRRHPSMRNSTRDLVVELSYPQDNSFTRPGANKAFPLGVIFNCVDVRATICRHRLHDLFALVSRIVWN
jgi:hypothetical protein